MMIRCLLWKWTTTRIEYVFIMNLIYFYTLHPFKSKSFSGVSVVSRYFWSETHSSRTSEFQLFALNGTFIPHKTKILISWQVKEWNKICLCCILLHIIKTACESFHYIRRRNASFCLSISGYVHFGRLTDTSVSSNFLRRTAEDNIQPILSQFAVLKINYSNKLKGLFSQRETKFKCHV